MTRKGLFELVKDGISRELKTLGIDIESKTIATRPTIYIPKQGTSGEPIEEPESTAGEKVRKPSFRDYLSAFFDHDEEVWRHV